MLTEPVVLLLIAAVISVFISLLLPRKKHRQGNKKSGQLKRLSQGGRYGGVTIRNGNCAGVKRLISKKFRLSEAPALPMPGCRSMRCPCSYTDLRERHTSKRRSSPDHRPEVRLGSPQPERRRMRNRRGSFHS
jgi:hypothetical protein